LHEAITKILRNAMHFNAADYHCFVHLSPKWHFLSFHIIWKSMNNAVSHSRQKGFLKGGLPGQTADNLLPFMMNLFLSNSAAVHTSINRKS